MVPTVPGVLAAGLSLLDPRVLKLTGLIVGVLLLAALVLALVDRWRKRQANAVFSANDELSQYRLLYQQGELSKDEFERIRGQVKTRLKETIEAAAPAPADAPPATTPPLATDLPPTAGPPPEIGPQNPQG